MTFEVRRVLAGWKHPKDSKGRYIPLFDGTDFTKETAEWDEGAAKWAQGLRRTNPLSGWVPKPDDGDTYADWAGTRPDPKHYMPVWPEASCTQIMMYENITEGTPVSPAFDTPESLALWLSENLKDGSRNRMPSFKQWLGIIRDATEEPYAPDEGSAPGIRIL